ncbi:hypothetical protein [Spirosoma pomorum]|jgi:hypothetical protein
MKHLLLFVFAGLVLAACSKKDDPTPSGPASTVAGNYTLSAFLLLDGADTLYLPQLPTTNQTQNVTVSGTLGITQVNNSTNFVDMLVTLKATGSSDATIPLDSVEVRQNGSSYDLYLRTLPLGTTDGKTVKFDVSQTDPQTGDRFRIAFNAQR